MRMLLKMTSKVIPQNSVVNLSLNQCAGGCGDGHKIADRRQYYARTWALLLVKDINEETI